MSRDDLPEVGVLSIPSGIRDTPDDYSNGIYGFLSSRL